jgi:N-acetylglucosaminyl-diphospho-decaprenol L-rhamnosyltransferase
MDDPLADRLADRLSVVLLTHNCAHRIRPILTRLLRLGVPVIAVDNASSDGTPELLRQYPGIELVPLRRNIGAAGRNEGALRAQTPYVAFSDDDGWYDSGGLLHAVKMLDRYPSLGLVNARILVGAECYLDPISVEMAASPLAEDAGVPGSVLMSFMAGAAIVRVSAYLEVGGYDPRFFLGGEEETLAFKLVKGGWQMRYVPEAVVHHHPSLENAGRLRHYGFRNTIVNAWLHRRFGSALRWTLFTVADTPKNKDFVRGVGLTIRSLGWALRERKPMAAALDEQIGILDARRFAQRRPLLSMRQRTAEDPTTWQRPEAQGVEQQVAPEVEQPADAVAASAAVLRHPYAAAHR